MQPAQPDAEKLYTKPGAGPEDDGELLDLRGGWLDPHRYLANNNVTNSKYEDGAAQPPQFYQANIEVQNYVNNPALSEVQHSREANQSQNNVTNTPGDAMPWTPNADHGEAIASDNVHKFLTRRACLASWAAR